MFELLREGGPSMWPLLACSIVAVAVVLDRALYLWHSRCDREALVDAVTQAYRGDGVEAAVAETHGYRGPLARIARHALMTVGASTPDELHMAVERMKALQTALLERRLYLLGTIGATAPFIGLFGTVLGIQRAFKQMHLQNNAGIGVVGAGVSEALVATAVGLGLAIIAVIAYNVFNNLVDRAALEMDLLGDEICSLLDAPRRA
jgi:biopolymer transport protein ExbB